MKLDKTFLSFLDFLQMPGLALYIGLVNIFLQKGENGSA